MTEHETAPVASVVIDGANAAAGGGFRPPTLRRLLDTRTAAAAKWPTARIITVVDAKLKYKLAASERDELDALCADGTVISTPSCTVGQGDAVVLALSASLDATIVSNDGYRDHIKEFPFLLDDGRVFGIITIDGASTVLVGRKLRGHCGLA